MKCEFKSQDTLIDVRKWLDSEVEIIPPAKSMPSFATTAYPYPTGYASIVLHYLVLLIWKSKNPTLWPTWI